MSGGFRVEREAPVVGTDGMTDGERAQMALQYEQGVRAGNQVERILRGRDRLDAILAGRTSAPARTGRHARLCHVR